jgi:hypothetical protein
LLARAGASVELGAEVFASSAIAMALADALSSKANADFVRGFFIGAQPRSGDESFGT